MAQSLGLSLAKGAVIQLESLTQILKLASPYQLPAPPSSLRLQAQSDLQ